MRLYRGNIIHTPTPEAFDVIAEGYVAVNDDGTVEGTYNEMPTHFFGMDVIDFDDRLLIPAMNDLHLHAPQFANMGRALDMQLLEWLETYTFPEETRFADLAHAESVYELFVKELWRQGTMRSAIFATIHPEATMLLADKLTASGMGAMIGLVGMDRNCPEGLRNSTQEVIEGTLRLADHLKGNDLVRPILTPRFVPSCSDEMMDALGRLAKEQGLPVQSHLSENKSEIEWVRKLVPEAHNYGDAYYRHGLFGQTPTLMAHCVYTDGDELKLMSEQRVMAVHCPTSNCNVASGMARVRHLMNNGVRVALGSDISAGHTMSMFRVMQYALQTSKIVHAQTDGREHFLSLSEVFWLATKSGGSFFGKVGAFEKDYDFDALVIDDSHGILSSLRTVEEASNDTASQLVTRLERYINLGDERNITHRFCRGQLLCE